MCARVFTLRVHSDCTSNLLFERVDKTAVELFIVRGTSENDVLASLTANNCCTGRLSSRTFYPSSKLSSYCVFHRVAFFLSLLIHSSIVSFFYDLAHADNSIFPCLQETRPRLAYLRVRQSDCLKIINPVETKKNRTDWFPRITKSMTRQ